MALDQSVDLNPGDTFSVVVIQTSPNNASAYFGIEKSVDDDVWCFYPSSSAGQSYTSTNGSSWTDYGKNNAGNLRIKAFTVDKNRSSSDHSSNAQEPTDNGSRTENGYTEAKVQAFVTRLYNKCLDRNPDTSGLYHWTTLLNSGTLTGADVAKGFVFSKEYTMKNTSNEEFVEMLYIVFMDRNSDASGKAHWVNYLNQGLSREYVFRGFVQSAEYTAICNSYGIQRGTVTLTQARDQNPNLTMFVSRLYTQALGRTYDVDGLNHWCRVIQTGTKTPQQVAEAFINSKEFQNKRLSNRQYIAVLYRTFMGRDYDVSGMNHWLHELALGCSRQEILARFAGSKEFRNIQASFGL